MNTKGITLFSPLPSPQRGEATAWSAKHSKKDQKGEREAHGPRPMPVYSPG